MRAFGIVLLALGALACAVAATRGGAAWLFLWFGGAFAVVGIAYLVPAHGLFGKRPDGALSSVAVVALFPFLALTWIIWRIGIAISREPAHHVLDRLVLARRLRAHEVPDDVDAIVDLTAEFREARDVIGNRRYRSLRLLDATAPTVEQLRAVFEELADARCILVHCAQGHGRTGVFAACWLIHHGHATTADAALAKVKAIRPGVRMNWDQRALVDRFAALSSSG